MEGSFLLWPSYAYGMCQLLQHFWNVWYHSWILIARYKLQIPYILHLLDEFLIIATNEELCKHQLSLFLQLCDYLGISMAPEKTVGSASTIAFAGIELDSVLMEARLPQDKLIKCR